MRTEKCLLNWGLFAGTLCALAATLLMGTSADAGGLASDSRVKVSATAGKIDATGKQLLTVTLVVDKKWHVYANPVKHEDYESIRTEIRVKSGAKLVRFDVRYPAGKLYIDENLPSLKLMVYNEKIDIPVLLQRAAGDVSPLDLAVTFCACDSKNCLKPSTVKIVLK